MNKNNTHFLIKLTAFLVFLFTIFSAFPNVTKAEFVAARIVANIKDTEIKVVVTPTWISKWTSVVKKVTISLYGVGGHILKEKKEVSLLAGAKEATVVFSGLAQNTDYQIETNLMQTVRDARAEKMETFISGAANPEIFKIKTLGIPTAAFMPGGVQLILDKSASEVKEVETQKAKEASKGEYNLLAPIGGMTEAPTDVGDYFNKIFLIAIGLCGALAVVMLIIGGIQYMGHESVFGKADAKQQMLGALGGLGIALAAYALLNTINPDLLGKGGINIKNLKVEIERTSGGGYFGVSIGTAGNPNANKNITTYDDLLKSASKKYGMECTLVKAFMYAESGGVNGQTSPAGAGGLIQLMPKTFQEQGYDISKIMDPATNINAGASYMSKLKKNGCNGKPKSPVCDISNIQYLAASYNGGPGANKESEDCKNSTLWQCTKYNGYAETRIYAPRVEANYNKLKEKNWGC